jgi:hypothetical protein
MGYGIDPLLISRLRHYMNVALSATLARVAELAATKPNSRHIGMQQSVLGGWPPLWLQSFAGGGRSVCRVLAVQADHVPPVYRY